MYRKNIFENNNNMIERIYLNVKNKEEKYQRQYKRLQEKWRQYQSSWYQNVKNRESLFE